jgi:heavy metal sensor kinase
VNSFRLRLALLAGAVTAALLLAVGFFAWQLTIRFNLDRLDRELRNLAKVNLERIGDRSHWARVDEALAFVSGPGRPPSYVLWVKNYDREEYRSPRWPAGIDPEKFPAPTTYDGGLTFATPPPPPRREQISPSNPALPSKEPYFLTTTADGSTWRIGVMGNPYTTLVLAADLNEFNRDLQGLRRRFLAAVPLALLIVGGGAWFLATRALRPVAALTRAAESITERGLDQRIAAPVHDREFQRLVAVFNAMMDRLEKGFHQARRFSADASHELRTPLARVQMELEQALQAARSGSPEQQTYSGLLEEIHRLKAIIQKLLLLSLADAGRLPLQKRPVDLSALLANIVEDCRAQSPGLAVESDIAPDLAVGADADLLEQALQNLAINALKYNRPDGWVRIAASGEGGEVRVCVENSGPPIPASDRDRIFERFFRSDPSRSGGTEGAGLGLSLAREIIRAHGGELTLLESDGERTRFLVTLAAAD